MKRSLASASPRTWNQKNLPSAIEEMSETPGGFGDTIEELPRATMGLLRRNRSFLVWSLLGLGTVGLVWYLTREE